MRKAIIFIIFIVIIGGICSLSTLDTRSKTFAIDLIITLATTGSAVVLLAIICSLINSIEILEAKAKALENDRTKIMNLLNEKFAEEQK